MKTRVMAAFAASLFLTIVSCSDRTASGAAAGTIVKGGDDRTGDYDAVAEMVQVVRVAEEIRRHARA